jgi:hypothetical protein
LGGLALATGVNVAKKATQKFVGYIYAPYIPVYITSTIDLTDVVPQCGFEPSGYSNKKVNQSYYGQIRLNG